MKRNETSAKRKKGNVYFCVAYSRYFSTSIHRVIDRPKKSFNITWMIVRMSYHIFYNLAELLNGYLAAKIGQGIISKYFMDGKCNCSLPSKVNRKCTYKGKYQSRCNIYEVTCFMCDAIYIINTRQTFKKRMDGHLSDLQCLLKNGQISDSFAAHFVHHFNNTTPRTYLRKCMTFKIIKKLNR